MKRPNRIAVLLAGVLAVALAGTVLATRQAPPTEEPVELTQDEEETPPTAEELAAAADRLRANQIPFEEATLDDLAARYGIGGAVRVLAWSNGNAELQAQIEAMRDSGGPEGTGMGWGRIAKELGVHPGIGSIMGNGGGQGRDGAPGQNRDEGDDAPGG